MTAEIGEHERAPRACESYPTSLRATLRAPPSKWAIKAFFPAGERSEPRSRTAPKGLPQTEARDAQRGGPPLESPCRQLSLVLSFASKESTSPLGAAAPPSAPESARQAPGRNCFRQSCLIMPLAGAFRSPPAPPRFVCQSEFTTPRDCTCTPRRSRRVNSRIRKLPTAKITYNTAREFSFSPHHRSK